MNLYEINAALMQAYDDAVDQETGEIIENEAYKAIDGLQMALEEKTENVLLWIKNLQADAEALKKEKMAFADRQARAEAKIESLKKYVGKVLDGQKFQTARVSASWRKSEAVEYAGNVFALPEDYIKYSDPTVDKTALKKALKNGEEIEGARLVIRQNLQIK